MELFFWISSVMIVSLQYFNHKYLGQGNLKKAYPIAIVVYIMYGVVETTLALVNPTQMGIMVFNLVNGWALYNAVKGMRRLKLEEQMSWADLYIEDLKHQKTVTFRPRGNSMVPLIKSGQRVTVEKIDLSNGDWSKIQKNDIVLCKVNGKQYLHLIYQKDQATGRVQIGNNKGHINGWTATVYGKVIEVGG